MRKISFIIFLLLSVSAVYFACQWQDLSWRQGFLRRHDLFGGCVIWDITQTVAADGSSGRVVTWQSPEPEEALELRETGSEDSVFVGAATEPVVGEEYYLHTVRLQNLKPGTSYEFRPRFTWASLRTGNGESFKALLFSDPQDGAYDFDGKLLQPAWRQHSDADFYAILGTPVAVAGNHWSRAWRLALPGSMLSSIPLVMVQGNFDIYHNSRQVELTKKLLRELPMPDNGNPNRQNQYYSFDYGAVHFVVFNTQFDETKIFSPGLQEDEMAWLKQDLASTDKKWKVVLLYKALFAFEAVDGSEPPIDGFTELGRLLMPIFDTYHVDAVVASSLHTYRRQQRLFQFAPHPEGTLYIMAGASSKLAAAQWKPHCNDVAVAPTPETGSYMTLEAGENRLQFTAYDLEGKAFDAIVLETEKSGNAAKP